MLRKTEAALLGRVLLVCGASGLSLQHDRAHSDIQVVLDGVGGWVGL